MIAAPSRPYHWPGGIPREIQVDANGDITPEQANGEAKLWLLFVGVKVLPQALCAVTERR